MCRRGFCACACVASLRLEIEAKLVLICGGQKLIFVVEQYLVILWILFSWLLLALQVKVGTRIFAPRKLPSIDYTVLYMSPIMTSII